MGAIIIGLDPGLATCGIAVVELHRVGLSVINLDVMRTVPSPKKDAVLAASDTLRRTRHLSAWLAHWLDMGGVAAVAAERFSAPRNASAAAKIGWAWGAIAALVEARGLPVIQPSPQEVKRALCGARDASKADVETACLARLGPGRHEAVEALRGGLPRGAHEHAWDALAVVLASLDSDLVRAIRPRGIDGREAGGRAASAVGDGDGARRAVRTGAGNPGRAGSTPGAPSSSEVGAR